MASRPLTALAAMVVVATLLILTSTGALHLQARALGPAATVEAYLPAVYSGWVPYACPTSSGNEYPGGIAYQYDRDDPVRPADEHADKNLELRGYTSSTDVTIRHELVDYASANPVQPPQLATLFSPYRVPVLDGFYWVHHWQWASSPDSGTRSGPISRPPVTALGLRTTPGETLHVPDSGYDIGAGMEVIVLFADDDTVALRYTRDDSSAPPGFTLHIDGICTDPNLLALYRQLDEAGGPRHVFPNPSYPLPALHAGQPVGTARGTEIVVAIADTGAFQDPRSCHDWWQVRPNYGGTCPPHE